MFKTQVLILMGLIFGGALRCWSASWQNVGKTKRGIMPESHTKCKGFSSNMCF